MNIYKRTELSYAFISGLCVGLEFPSAAEMDYGREEVQKTTFVMVLELGIIRLFLHIFRTTEALDDDLDLY